MKLLGKCEVLPENTGPQKRGGRNLHHGPFEAHHVHRRTDLGEEIEALAFIRTVILTSVANTRCRSSSSIPGALLETKEARLTVNRECSGNCLRCECIMPNGSQQRKNVRVTGGMTCDMTDLFY